MSAVNKGTNETVATTTDRAGPEIFTPHDHAACVSNSFAAAEARCESGKVRLTENRRRVLDLLLEEHRPMGAYAILERLRAIGYSAQPPVAYRALDFLMEKGLAHRIESLNAYVACSDPENCTNPAFLVCQVCDRVAEAQADDRPSAAALAAGKIGFVIEQEFREARGTCPSCTNKA